MISAACGVEDKALDSVSSDVRSISPMAFALFLHIELVESN